MYVCMHACMYVCMYVRMYVCMIMYVCMHACMYVRKIYYIIYIYICVCVWVCVCVIYHYRPIPMKLHFSGSKDVPKFWSDWDAGHLLAHHNLSFQLSYPWRSDEVPTFTENGGVFLHVMLGQMEV